MNRIAQSFRTAFVVLLLSLSASWAAAQALIVDREAVEKAIAAGAIVWDTRSADDYAKGHIPGAVNLGAAGDVFRDPNREDPPSAAAASRIFGAAGMDVLGRPVIAYSTRGDPFAYYAARMIEYYGGKHGQVYHGGLDDWRSAGKAVETAATKLPPVALSLATERRGAISTREVLERVKGGNSQILDTRTPKEFTGEDIRAIRGGRVAGAISVPYEQNWVDPAAASKLASKQVTHRDGMALKSQEDLKAIYAKLDPAKETIVYCQSAVRASETAAVLRTLGFKDVKVYEESWLGYAGNLSAPAEDEVFVNVGAINARMATLQSRVNELEAELGKMKAPAAR